MKNPPEFYAARDDVEGGRLPKCNMRTLRKHLAALQVRQPWESDPLGAGATMRKTEWLAKIKKEIENKKSARKDIAISILVKVVAGLLVVGLVSLLSFLFFS